MVGEFECPNYPKSCAVGGYLPLGKPVLGEGPDKDKEEPQ